MYKLYRSLTNSSFAVILFSAMLSLVMFSPWLSTKNPASFLRYDVLGLYYPQFVHGYYLFMNHVFTGIDFSTDNGASVYFLRPNMPVYYPIYQLSYVILASNAKHIELVFILVLVFQAFLSIYFCTKVGRNFFKLNIASGLVFANLYTWAIFLTILETPFYFVATLFPMVVYVSLKSVIETRYWKLLLATLVYLLILLAGYMPLCIHALGIAILFSILYYYYIAITPRVKFSTFVLRLGLPIFLALIIVSPLYIAILKYNSLVQSIPHTQWIAAISLSAKMSSILTMISSAFTFYVPEGLTFVIGLVPFVLTLMYIKHREVIELDILEKNMILISVLIILFHTLLIFGNVTGLPSLFFFLVPGLGSMHIYSRFLYVGSFFFFLVFAILLDKLVWNKNQLRVSNWVKFFSTLGLVLLVLQPQINKLLPSLSVETLVFEIIALVCTLFAFSHFKGRSIYIVLIMFSFLLSAAKVNRDYQFTTENHSYQDSVLFSQKRSGALNKYLNAHSSKQFIKYADLTESIERPTGVISNYPWMIPPQSSRYISNYMGYELHLAVDRNYPFPYFGRIDIPYLINTGADYIIYDASVVPNPPPEVTSKLPQDVNIYEFNSIFQLVDSSIPVLDLDFGYKVAKLQQLNQSLVNGEAMVFNNGIIRVDSKTESTQVVGFKTDYSSFVSFKIINNSFSAVQYLLFPNKYLHLEINGKEIPITLTHHLMTFQLYPGTYNIRIIYKNGLQSVFLILYAFFLSILSVVLLWRFLICLRVILLRKTRH